MKHLSLLLVCVGLSLFLSGCQTYFKDRAYDLMDIGGMEVSAGAQFGFNARATKVAQVGAGFNTGDKAAWDGRTLAVFEENRREFGIGFIYGNGAERHVHMCNDNYVKYDEFEEKKDRDFDLERGFDRGFWEIGGHVGLGFVGFGAYVDPMQLFDFVLGIFAVDFARDDTRNDYRERLSGLPFEGWPEFPPSATEE